MGGFVSRESTKPNLRRITEANDGLTKYRLLNERRNLVLAGSRQRSLLRVFDKRLDYLGTLTAERSAKWKRQVDNSGAGTIRVQWSNWLAQMCVNDVRVQEDLHLAIDMNPNKRHWRTRLGYKITDVRAIKNEDGTRHIELDIISLREHAKHILLGATPFSPPEFQPLKSWVWFQNLRSNLAFSSAINLARTYWPPLSLPTNFMNPVHWITTRVGNISPLHWPVQIQFVNPVLDQSRTLPLAAKWQDLHTISEPLLDDAGCILVDYLWLPEDEESPHPELAALIGNDLARPTRAAVILAFEDRSGVTGPTGTAVDGALNLIGATLDNTITEMVFPLLDSIDSITESDMIERGSKTPPFFRRLLGVAAERPSLVWRDCEYSGLLTSTHTLTKPGAQTIWTGGHSPTWLNQVQTFLIRYALSQISEVIMYTAPGGMAAYQGAMSAPGSPGLENVYQGQFDDIFLAYSKFTNPATALWMNDYGWVEDFEHGNGYAYVVSAALTIRQGLHRNRARASFKMTARDGHPWCYGYDYTVGDRGLFEVGGIYCAEAIRSAEWEYDETTPIHTTLEIGKDDLTDPFESAMRALAGGWNAIGSLLGGAAVAA